MGVARSALQPVLVLCDVERLVCSGCEGAAVLHGVGEAVGVELPLQQHYALCGIVGVDGPPMVPYSCMCAACGKFGHSTHTPAALSGCKATELERLQRNYIRMAALHKAHYGPPVGAPLAGQ